MKKTAGLIIICILFFPSKILAADFIINDTNIDAFLKENGIVQVFESHTYEFDGDFNGITRSLIPKEGASITDFTATENNKPLVVEQEEELYRVYRNGEDETITIELTYVIRNGVEVYQDMVQFYWPFFDTSNESEYENMTINVHPPKETQDVIAYGFDEAQGSESIESNGSVIFELGFVDDGKKGDIRVAYDKALFSDASITDNQELRDEIIRGKKESEEEMAIFFNRQQSLNNIAPVITGIFAVIFSALLFYAWRRKRSTDIEADRIYHSHSFVPNEIMSMPATIYYYRNNMIGHGEMLTIGMMDLLRKGNIEKEQDETYRLIKDKTDFEHENKLINLLFNIGGNGKTFSFEQLDEYIENTENKSKFNNGLVEYQKAVMEEINSHQLYDKYVTLRLSVGLISLLLIPFMILLGMYDLYMWLFISMALMFGLLFFSFVFSNQTPEGKVIKRRWKTFEKEYADLPENKWNSLTEEEKERALIFSAGLKNKKVNEKSRRIMENYENSNDNTVYLMMVLYTLSSIGNNRFEKTTEVSAASGGTPGSSYIGSGTGAGGGGGGSGAF